MFNISLIPKLIVFGIVVLIVVLAIRQNKQSRDEDFDKRNY